MPIKANLTCTYCKRQIIDKEYKMKGSMIICPRCCNMEKIGGNE